MAEQKSNQTQNNLKRLRYFVPLPGSGGIIGMLGGGMLGISILGVFTAIIIATFFLLFLNPNSVNGGVPPPVSGGGTAPPGQTPTCSEVDTALSQQLKASVIPGAPGGWYCTSCPGLSNPSPEIPDCPTKQDFWKLWTHLTLSTSFKARLTSIAYRAEFFFDPTITGGFGYTGWPYKTQLKDPVQVFKQYGYTAGAFWITHETTHMLQGRDRSLENNFDVAYFKTHGDSNCYIGNFIKTYGAIGFSGISYTRESMAEATALYVYNSKSGKYGTITNFKNQCPATYNWIHRYLFPDYEFN